MDIIIFLALFTEINVSQGDTVPLKVHRYIDWTRGTIVCWRHTTPKSTIYYLGLRNLTENAKTRDFAWNVQFFTRFFNSFLSCTCFESGRSSCPLTCQLTVLACCWLKLIFHARDVSRTSVRFARGKKLIWAGLCRVNTQENTCKLQFLINSIQFNAVNEASILAPRGSSAIFFIICHGWGICSREDSGAARNNSALFK